MRNNTDILFSLVIPTRNRLSLLQNCLTSFFTKACRPHLIEAILMCDLDDESMKDFNKFILNNGWNIKMMFQHQSDKMIRDYNNYGGQCTTGKYVWILNDDYEMVTDGWDDLTESKVNEFLADKPDRILYIHLNDSTHTNWGIAEQDGCCCPIISKETVDIQNGIMPLEIDMWGADKNLYYIFRKLPKNRILNIINDLKVLHHCIHNGTMLRDNISQRVESVSRKVNLTPAEIDHYVQLFSRYL